MNNVLAEMWNLLVIIQKSFHLDDMSTLLKQVENIFKSQQQGFEILNLTIKKQSINAFLIIAKYNVNRLVRLQTKRKKQVKLTNS